MSRIFRSAVGVHPGEADAWDPSEAAAVRIRELLKSLGAIAVAAALAFAQPLSAQAQSGADGIPSSPKGPCTPLPEVLGTVKKYVASGKAKTTIFIDAPGAALLQQINAQSGEWSEGSGVFAFEMVGYEQVIIGVITTDHSKICDRYMLTTDGWEAIQTAALGRVAMLTWQPV